MSDMRGSTCKTCKTKYHICSSCWIGGLEEDVMWEGYCSIECWSKSDEQVQFRNRIATFVSTLTDKQKGEFVWLLENVTENMINYGYILP